MKRFGELIEEACRNQGVSQTDLARALGRTPPWTLHIFNGKNLSERVLKECARALDLELRVELVPKPPAKRRMKAVQASKSRRGLRKRNGQ